MTDKRRNIIQRISRLFIRNPKTTPAPAKNPPEPPTTHIRIEKKVPQPDLSFYGMSIAPGILNRLGQLGFKTPTPIQHKTIPVALEGKDVVGIAQTGTGKTLAFCIPMYQRLAQVEGKGLILVPTRELALQVDEVFHAVGHSLNMRTVVLIGGVPMWGQLANLKRMPRIIIATPGRLIDHLEQGTVSLKDICVLVIDEADRMLDMGFIPQIERILHVVPDKRQTMLFSATIPQEIMYIASRFMRIPVNIEIAPSGTVAEKISQELFIVDRSLKLKLLRKLLSQYHGSVLLFTRTKRGARLVASKVREMGHSAADINSDRSLSQRKVALDGFKAGKFRVLVATDIASRGIDVKGIEVVINYDVPDDPENYVHRIGRTGRIGKEGHAITLATREQKKDVAEIERLIKASIPVSKHPDMPVETFSQIQPESSGYGRRPQGRPGGYKKNYSRNSSSSHHSSSSSYHSRSH